MSQKKIKREHKIKNKKKPVTKIVYSSRKISLMCPEGKDSDENILVNHIYQQYRLINYY